MDKEISDASDFLHTRIPNLSQLDTLLRCHICKDFLKVPVLTPCGHTFCSLCIRGYINNQAKCPLCLNELRESMLRSEFLVSEIVDTYKNVRSDLLEILKNNDNRDNNSIIVLESDQDISEDIELKEELLDDESGSDDIEILGSSERNYLKRTATDILPKTPQSSFNSNKIAKRSLTSSKIESMFQKPQSTEMAQCPICEKFFPIKQLERTHLDECLTLQSLDSKPKNKITTITSINSQSKSATCAVRTQTVRDSFQQNRPREQDVSHVNKYLNSSLETDHQRLPKLDLASMPLNQIKQKLSNIGLSTLGTKQDMISRYNYYEILWNSNFCDSINPLDESELKRQLVCWEISQRKNSTRNEPKSIGRLMALKSNKNNKQDTYKKLLINFKNDKFSRKGWSRLFNRKFILLIKNARNKIPRKSISICDIKEQDGSSNSGVKNKDTSINNEQLTDPDLSTEFIESLEKRKPSEEQ